MQRQRRLFFDVAQFGAYPPASSAAWFERCIFVVFSSCPLLEVSEC